jgi:hypothetical protein
MKHFLFTPILCALVALLLPQSAVRAQWRKAMTLDIGGGYAVSMYDKGDVHESNRANKMQMNDVNIRAAYYITPLFALGLGFNGNLYYKIEKSVNVLNINVLRDITPSVFVLGNFGFAMGSNDITEGAVLNVGGGYRLWQSGDGWSLNGSLCYRFFNYAYTWHSPNYTTSVEEERFNHAVFIGLNIEYSFASTRTHYQNEYTAKKDAAKRREYWLSEIILFLFGWGAGR